MSDPGPGNISPFLTYKEALDWLYSTQLFGIKLGLEPTRNLLNDLGAWPAEGVLIFHVAGTNGKGSVCAFLDRLCRARGLKTGLFTSPHLVDFTERFRVDGEPMPAEAATRLLSHLRARVRDWPSHPTFFELVTAMGMAYFREQGVQAIVLETGMGGRLDSTNAVLANVSIITRIDLDHQKWLGDTLAQIAEEKAGIIKSGVPVITVPQEEEALSVLEHTAKRHHSPLTVVEQPYTASRVGLAGSHQPLHAAVALEAMARADVTLDRGVAAQALAETSLDGRFQLLTASGEPARTHTESRFILDGAHNPSAAARLARTWREEFGDERAVLVCGALGDKDADSIVRELSAITDLVFPAPVNSPRALTLEEMAWTIQRYAPNTLAPETAWKNAASAGEVLDRAVAYLAEIGADRRILVTGSLFLVGAALAHLSAGGTAPRTTAQ